MITLDQNEGSVKIDRYSPPHINGWYLSIFVCMNEILFVFSSELQRI